MTFRIYVVLAQTMMLPADPAYAHAAWKRFISRHEQGNDPEIAVDFCLAVRQ
jgi:hypothetical protein